MMPPDCPLCEKTLEDSPDETFETVSFKTSPGYVESDLEGHPDHVVWFCSEHYEAAAAMASLPRDEALLLLRQRSSH